MLFNSSVVRFQVNHADTAAWESESGAGGGVAHDEDEEVSHVVLGALTLHAQELEPAP